MGNRNTRLAALIAMILDDVATYNHIHRLCILVPKKCKIVKPYSAGNSHNVLSVYIYLSPQKQDSRSPDETVCD